MVFVSRLELKRVENLKLFTNGADWVYLFYQPRPIMFTLLLRFYRDRFLSRWTVLFFDVTATLIALIASIAIRFNFSVDAAQRVLNIYSFTGVLALYCVGFIFIGSYKGILRHTSLDDVKNVLKGSNMQTIWKFMIRSIQIQNWTHMSANFVLRHLRKLMRL